MMKLRGLVYYCVPSRPSDRCLERVLFQQDDQSVPLQQIVVQVPAGPKKAF